MLEKMPENIKSAYIISIFTMIFFPLLGIFFNYSELYFGYLVGAVISAININLLINFKFSYFFYHFGKKFFLKNKE